MSHRPIMIAAALLALAAHSSPAGAGMPGGIAAPGSLARGDGHIPTTSSIGSSARTFTPDGAQLRTRGEHWKKPIDSDGGGTGDPPKKPPKDPQTSDSGDNPPRRPHGGFYPDGWHHHPHVGPGFHQDDDGGTEPPLACRGRPGGC